MPCRAVAAPLMQRHHELQGPRPATLVVAKDSHAVKKRRQAQAARQQPVIIYVESPKVVHAHPGEFRSVVQRLTGAPAPSAQSPPPPMFSSAAAAAPPPRTLQFPFQLYGLAQEALSDGDRALPPFVASTVSPPTAAAGPAPPVPGSCLFASYLRGDASSRSLGFFSDDQLSPAFLPDQNMVSAMGGPSSVRANMLASSAPLVLPALGDARRFLGTVDRFVDQ